MSTLDNKKALFGKSNGALKEKTTGTTPNDIKPKQTKTTTMSAPVISPELKAKKITEAKDLISRAMKNLQTSIFQWSPDHLAAASLFESASNIYVSIGDNDEALVLLEKSINSHQASGVDSAAALALVKASKITQAQKLPKKTAEYLERAAEVWGTNGDLEKYSDLLAKAAKELEQVEPSRAVALYQKSCDMLCPPSMAKQQLSSCSIHTLDIYRAYFTFVLSVSNYKDALGIAERMVDIFEAHGSDSSMCKTMAGITILQLYLGDIVLADRTFMQVHLNNSAYCKSFECALAEDFIGAFKDHDADKLEATQSSHRLAYLDRDIQVLAKKLSIFNKPKPKEKPTVPVAPPSISSAKNTSSTTQSHISYNKDFESQEGDDDEIIDLSKLKIENDDINDNDDKEEEDSNIQQEMKIESLPDVNIDNNHKEELLLHESDEEDEIDLS